jgi:hypothetical protein
MTILTFYPELAANMIGRSNARRGARRIFAVLQNRRLNQHIAYTVVDEVGVEPPLDFSSNTSVDRSSMLFFQKQHLLIHHKPHSKPHTLSA